MFSQENGHLVLRIYLSKGNYYGRQEKPMTKIVVDLSQKYLR